MDFDEQGLRVILQHGNGQQFPIYLHQIQPLVDWLREVGALKDGKDPK